MSLAAAAAYSAVPPTDEAGSVPPSHQQQAVGGHGGRVINNEEVDEDGDRQQIDQGRFQKRRRSSVSRHYLRMAGFAKDFVQSSSQPLIPEWSALLDNFSLESTKKRP